VPTITVRELARNTAAVIQEVESSCRPALVTRNGRPVAALVAIDEAALEEWLLAQAPEFSRSTAHPSTATPEPPPEHLRGSHRGP
jgi:prevent-host-death family protein